MARATKEKPRENDSIWELLVLWLLMRHRERQEEIAEAVQNNVIRMFGTLRFEDLDRTQFSWVDATLPAVRDGYEQSQQASIAFMEDYRSLRLSQMRIDDAEPMPKIVLASAVVAGLPEGEIVEVAPEFNEQQAAARLLATGPARVKKAMPARKQDAMAKGLKGAVGSAVQTAMQGGREVTQQRVQNDSLITGYQRITDSDPCYFCALLAANGPVFTSATSFSNRRARDGRKFEPNAAFEATGEPDGIAKVHDHCRCVLVPVYEYKSQETEAGRVGLELWKKAKGLNDYRSLYDAYRRANGPVVDRPVSNSSVMSAVAGIPELQSWASALTAA